MNIDGKEITITHPEKVLWPDAHITKLDYVRYLIEVSDYILPYTKDRMLMYWLYPHGLNRLKVEKRSLPANAPDWIPSTFYKGKERIILNDLATLVWLGQYGALELHVPFDQYTRPNHPTDLVFDLDPSTDDFDLVLKIALELKGVLDGMGLKSIPKTSGKSGLQVYVPVRPEYPFEQTRKVNKFIADYMLEKLPKKITLDRVKKRRGNRLYFDYLQLWKGRTMAVPYTVRATKHATVSTPVTWQEVQHGFKPTDFTMDKVIQRVKDYGDLFRPDEMMKKRNNQHLTEIVDFIKSRT
ncbi:non-homologous end-joining DNA ligase [Alkalihalobacillus sp. AL-G]|uniref:non-homologous end-joining DNA ligase n=1 Tax=Alkalihalobacillus sp. AL-G TaxID=2926399 RepID=UPI00272ACBF3|nr:non-homologous end-joining DNA ligase [Alkalihalobacillus sp. AL-G]WLD94517.1 non-homologous end-joining DNA ligase [Alkalihalobacillus sp. AL-G]